MIEFYDAENLVFYDGAGYADHCQLKLIKTVDAPAIQTSMTAPDYEEKVQKYRHNTWGYVYSFAGRWIHCRRRCRQSGLRCAKRYHRNSGGCPQLGASQRLLPFYQPYQIDASIKFNWNTDIDAYTGPAPYGYNRTTQPYAPFYLTEYKFNGTALKLSGDRTKAEDCTINKGEYGQHLPAVYHAKQRGSAVLSALPNCI